MKLNAASKIIPNSFYRHSEDAQEFSEGSAIPLKSVDNKLNAKSGKKNRKNVVPKIFVDDFEEEDTAQRQRQENREGIVEDAKYNEHQQTKSSHNLSKDAKPTQNNLLLQFEIGESSSPDQEKYDQILEPSMSQNTVGLPKLDKLKLVDWSNSSQQIEQIELQNQIQQRKQTFKKAIKNETIIFNKQRLFRRLQKGVQCMLRRDKKSTSGYLQYSIYLKDNLNHIVTVRKQGAWNYSIYSREKGKGEQFFKYTKIGALQSSFLGNKFTLLKDKQRFSNATIYYQTNILGLSGPRKMFVYLPKTPLPFEDLEEMYDDLKYRQKIQKFVSRTAKWNEEAKSYVLDCHGRAKESSIKNFVITDKQETQKQDYIIFGKEGPDVFNLDIHRPFSLIQGIAVALTTFERKITCD